MLDVSGVFGFIVYPVICYLIAHYIGKKRRIGFGWSFFFSFFMSPLIGFFVTALSSKLSIPVKQQPKSTLKVVIGFVLLILGVMMIFSGMNIFSEYNSYGYNTSLQEGLTGVFIGVSFVGLGIYINQTNKATTNEKED